MAAILPNNSDGHAGADAADGGANDSSNGGVASANAGTLLPFPQLERLLVLQQHLHGLNAPWATRGGGRVRGQARPPTDTTPALRLEPRLLLQYYCIF